MSKKEPPAPLYYALVQVRFNHVVAMESYILPIQEKMRLEGYTLFTPQHVDQLIFNKSAPVQGQILRLPRWQITKQDQSSGFILHQDSLAYHTTKYTTHKQFLKDFLSALSWIHNIVKFEHLSRMGLRYLNAVVPPKDQSIKKYVVNGLHGVILPESLRYALSESVFDTALKAVHLSGTLVSRCFHRFGLLGYPPDIGPNDLRPLAYFDLKEPRLHAVLDIDHFIEQSIPIDFDRSEKILLALHSKIKNTLNAMITDYAQELWFKE